MEESISLQGIVEILKKRLLLILIFMVISIGIAVGISFYVITPIYQAQTQILVNQNNNTNQSYSWESTQIDLQLINTYSGIITSPVILTPVIEELQLEVSLEELMKQISVGNKSDSKLVNISVLDPDPVQAVTITNTVAEVFKEKIPQLMSVDNITILSVAKLSENPTPVKPNKKLNITVAGLIGLMLGIGVAFLREFLNTTIKSEKDIEDILDLPVMGVVSLITKRKNVKSSSTLRRVRGD